LKGIETKRRKKTTALVLLCIVLAVVICCILLIDNGRQRAEYNFKSLLSEAIDIGELSTSKLILNGIVHVPDKDGQKVLYSVAYNSTIKVGIEMDDIDFDIDGAQKTVNIILPAISIHSPVIDVSSISCIPHDPPSFDPTTAIAACREDARHKAEQSTKLIQTAEENLKSIIEALTLPLLKDEGYSIVW